MKPDWDKLKELYAGDARKLVAEVDCRTKPGAELCRRHSIEKHPSVKWGSADALVDYEGHRGFDAISDFAKKTLKRTCSPSSLDECDAETKTDIEKMMSLSHTELQDEFFKAKEAQRGGADGFCNLNHYSDTLKEQGTPVIADVEACAAKCAEESKCKSFSISPKESCFRYEVLCSPDRMLEDSRFTTYNKVVQEEGKGDLSDFKLVRLPKEKTGEESEQAKARQRKEEHRLGYIQSIKATKRQEL